MSKRIFQIVAIVVLVLAALTPLMECFDHWDRSGPPANDTEIHLTAWFVGAGVVLVLSKVLRQSPALTRSKVHECGPHPALQTKQERSSQVEPTSSPPLIPLRI